MFFLKATKFSVSSAVMIASSLAKHIMLSKLEGCHPKISRRCLGTYLVLKLTLRLYSCYALHSNTVNFTLRLLVR